MRFLVLFLIQLSLYGLNTGGGFAQTPAATDPPPVAPFVTHVRSIPINGTDAHPVFDLQDVAVRDSVLYVLDQQGATLTAFTERGDVIYQVGRPGAGPGEFTNPMQVEFIPEGRLVVLEGMGNNRAQIIEARSGESVGTMSRDLMIRPVTRSALVRERPRGVILTTYTGTFCSTQEAKKCVVQQYNMSTERLIQRFGRPEEINPEFTTGMPWLVGQSNDGETFVAHHAGRHVAIYDADGEFLDRFPIDAAPSFDALDPSGVPSRPRDAVKELRNRTFSAIENIAVADSDVIVDHYLRTPNGIDSRHLSIFSRDGTHEVDGPARSADLKLIDVEDDRFYFVETKPSELGSYVIHEYRYTGT